VPKLWTQTIETHRREVGDAILDTTAALVAEQGLRGVTMSQIAEQAGIGRATLYKYYPDVEAILVAWHKRHAAGQLAHLSQLRDQAGDPEEALQVVLHALAIHLQQRAKNHGGADLAALVHQDQHVKGIEDQLHGFLKAVISAAATAGHARTDIPADELANYCLHALSAAGNSLSRAAVGRLIELTLTGLRPPPPPAN
jgi:AcrR family transcriptional regulator